MVLKIFFDDFDDLRLLNWAQFSTDKDYYLMYNLSISCGYWGISPYPSRSLIHVTRSAIGWNESDKNNLPRLNSTPNQERKNILLCPSLIRKSIWSVNLSRNEKNQHGELLICKDHKRDRQNCFDLEMSNTEAHEKPWACLETADDLRKALFKFY